MAHHHGAVGWYAVCDCGFFCSYTHLVLQSRYLAYTILIDLYASFHKYLIHVRIQKISSLQLLFLNSSTYFTEGLEKQLYHNQTVVHRVFKYPVYHCLAAVQYCITVKEWYKVLDPFNSFSREAHTSTSTLI